MYRMKIYAALTVVSIAVLGFMFKNDMFEGSKTDYKIETADIDRFWSAYDSLKLTHTHQDSIDVIQNLYLDKMSRPGKKFIDVRQYTAAEYLRTIRRYPKYLAALRAKTTNLTGYRSAIDSAFQQLKKAIPGYRVPDVCFAIGCFRGGGTTRKDLLLMGAEIALADSTIDCSEFKGWLHTVLSTSSGNIVPLIAHESIHCQQHHGQNRTLLSIALQEGTADFLPALILKTNINGIGYQYGLAHECELWHEFEPQKKSEDLSPWLFNSLSANGRPADLGYFVGARICEAYYNKQTDKKQAILTLLNRGKYLEVMAQSDYNGGCAKE
jgi:hypothetical protein